MPLDTEGRGTDIHSQQIAQRRRTRGTPRRAPWRCSPAARGRRLWTPRSSRPSFPIEGATPPSRRVEHRRGAGCLPDCDGDGHGWRLLRTAPPSSPPCGPRPHRLGAWSPSGAGAGPRRDAGRRLGGRHAASYGGHVRAWQAWCRAEGIPALPLEYRAGRPNHLIDYAFALGLRVRRVGARQRRRCCRRSASTVGGRLAALNKAAEFVGSPRPGDNAGVAEVMRGIRRRLLVAPEHRKAALDLKLLTRCLAAVTGATFVSTRNRVAVLLGREPQATAGQLAKLGWADLLLQRGQVVVELRPRSQARRLRRGRRNHHSNPDLCLVARALRTLRGLWPGGWLRC